MLEGQILISAAELHRGKFSMDPLIENEGTDFLGQEESDSDEEEMIIMKMIIEKKREQGSGWSGSESGRNMNRFRDTETILQRLMNQYFNAPDELRTDGTLGLGPIFNGEEFARVYRMSQSCLRFVFSTLSANDSFFSFSKDAAGKPGIPPILKVVCALNQLTYAISAKKAGDDVGIAESTANVCRKRFCASIVTLFKAVWLRRPTTTDLRTIEQQFQAVGFPGCVGCVDCSGMQWEQCPTALQGIMVGKEGKPTLRMEIICDLNLRIWSLFSGLPGHLNDINILELSPFFSDLMTDQYPKDLFEYEIDGEKFDWLYFLGDGIYGGYKFIMRTIPNPKTQGEKMYVRRQEGVRKCEERLFGVVYKQFKILCTP